MKTALRVWHGLTAVLSVALLMSTALAHAQTMPTDEVTQVEDVIVDGAPIRSEVQRFVGTVAAPAPSRGPARWDGDLCVGVVNLQTEAAQFMADRISDIGAELGLRIGGPGCKPNLVVMATSDGAALASELVRTRPREFMVRTGGASLGREALEAFQTSDRPVRWWHVSLPVNEDTGLAAVRLPGQQPFAGGPISRPSDLGSYGMTVMPSRINNEIKDELQQVLIIVDISRLGQAPFDQVADYTAMVGLAQIDPDVDMSHFQSILNLFRTDEALPSGLTDFDWAYLRGLYEARQMTISARGRVGEVAAQMERALRARPTELNEATP